MNTATRGKHRQSIWQGFAPIATALLALALLLVLTACGGTTAELEPAAETSKPSFPPPAAAQSPEPVVEQTSEPEPEPEYGGFGGAIDGYTWDDGISVYLSGLEEFTPSEWAAFDESPAYVRFTITLINNSSEPFDPAMFTETVQSGNAEGSAVFDTDAGLEGAPMTSVLPGREVSWIVGYGVADPADLVVQLAPSWDHDDAIFIGGL
jgi:hypothetical protein